MEKQQVIKIFLEKGYQLDAEVLERLYKNENAIESLLNSLSNIKNPMITIDVLEQVLTAPGLNIKIIKQKQAKLKKVFVENFTQLLNNRYNFFKKILETRMDLVNPISINKISSKTKKFSLIAAVKDKDESMRSITVEDSTGETCLLLKTQTNFDELLVDDIVGFVCEIDDGAVKAEKIIFSDVPFKKEVSKTKEEIYCLFISDIFFEDSNFKNDSFQKFLDWLGKTNYSNLVIFILGNVSVDKSKLEDLFKLLPPKSVKVFQKSEMDSDIESSVTKISSPCFIEIDGVVILVCNDSFLLEYKKAFNKTIDVALLNLLKRRNLNPLIDHKKEIYENDPFLVDVVPDIIVAANVSEPARMNYKSTTILANGSFTNLPIFWLVNLKNREIIKLDFT